MGFNNNIQPSRYSIADIVPKLNDQTLFVDRSFQRRLVWTEKQKVRLIETIFIEYPMPEIYLWDQKPDPNTAQTKMSIVDGQQRLTTIKQFLGNEWKLKTRYLNDENQSSPYANLYWKDIPPDLRSRFYEYNINSRRIPSDINKDQIRLIFARLNETDRSLNPQEMRNATLNGEFLTASAALSDSDEMKALNIFSPNDIRRMIDIEFSSQLLSFERQGVVDSTPDSIDRLYDTYSEIYEEKFEDIKKVKTTLSRAAALFKNSKIRDLFESQNNLYTLHALLSSGIELSQSELERLLENFAKSYRLEGDTSDPNILQFREGSSSRTRSKASRIKRFYGLTNWIQSKLNQQT